MVNKSDQIKIQQKYVLVFDICSSTKIFGQLKDNGSEKNWCNLLTEVAVFLEKERKNIDFIIYKFIGDGWILLFENNLSPKVLFLFLDRLHDKYALLYNKMIEKKLFMPVDKIGLTIGLDFGQVFLFELNNFKEYIGWPIIIATRLQGAIKDNDKNPQDKLLMSKEVYKKLHRFIPPDHKVWKVSRKLKNVLEGEKYKAFKYEKRKK